MINPLQDNIKTITDLREKTLEILTLVGQKKKPVFVFHSSRPTNVIMVPQDEYLEMLEMIEDYFDELEAIQMEKEPKKGGVLLEKVMEEYKIKPRAKKKK